MQSEGSRKITRRSLVAGAALAVPALATVGGVQSRSRRAAAQEKTQISWLTNSDWPLDQVIAGFQAENPDIEVVPEAVGADAITQQIQVKLGAKSADPDVLSVDVPNTSSYGYQGWLAPLDDVFTDAEKADWLGAATQAGTYEGALLAAPVNTSTQLFYYNADLWQQAGVTPPGIDDRWTWEQLAEVAPKLTTRNGDQVTTWGFVWEQMIQVYQLGVLPASLGGQMIGDDGLTAKGVIDSQPWIDAFTYYSNAFNEWKFAPTGDVFWPPDIFETGQLASFVGGPWDIRRFAESEAVTFNWGVSRNPYFAAGSPATPTGGWHIGVNANSTKQEAAKRFVHYLSTAAGNELWWRTGSGDMPALQSVLKKFETEPEFANPPLAYLKTAANEATVNPVPRANTVIFPAYASILSETFQDIRNGADPADALSGAADRIDREAAKFKR